jgi:peptidoglycan hydrolase-like protein with peptidoglycan-binding domain
MEVWGGQDLSNDSIWYDRPIVGGKLPSSHRGAAFDWRYMNPGPGRPTMLKEIRPFLINHSYELNVQQIHDYVGCTIWKASRSGDANGGWKTQARGAQMGQKWAGWLHIEAGEWGWNDGRDVPVRIGVVNDDNTCATAPPVTDLEHGFFGLYPFDTAKRWLWEGALGDDVKYLQSVIYHRAGGAIAIDGGFGMQTVRRVRDLQTLFGLTVDGKVGPQTWGAVDTLART